MSSPIHTFMPRIEKKGDTGVTSSPIALQSSHNPTQSLPSVCNLFPKAFPNDYKSIEILAGDGNSPGSIRFITYGPSSELVKTSKEKIESVDLEKRSFTYSIMDGDMLKYYKSFTGTITVTPKDGGSLVKWSGEFVKTGHEIEDPHVIKDFAVKNFKEIDEHLLKQ
ncbi:PREDICTED: MLP-like protein 423 [Tarenaya hassleriana]|uniref:MLP-like protein 423 n=1 Tax=Tarenaya hassleriana TaxID=28532 RepID=UPI00053C2373|nr:PREDICTED: MLP-like protein 423 [Tarenaya hassleriana]